MGKYNLGKSKTSVNVQITKDNLYIDEKRCKKLEKSIEKNLDVLEKSMMNIEVILNKAVKTGAVTSSRAKVFKSWGRKCKSQANSASKLKEKISTSFAEDAKNYPIKLLDERIMELEKKLASLEKVEKR